MASAIIRTRLAIAITIRDDVPEGESLAAIGIADLPDVGSHLSLSHDSRRTSMPCSPDDVDRAARSLAGAHRKRERND
jgi:hypothetical protein